MSLPSRVCVVTGASYGLGSHIAKQLATKDWEIVLVARSKDKLEQVKQEIEAAGGAALAVSCDITSQDSIDKLKQTIEARFPQGIECVINNAAYVPPLHTFVEGDVSEWARCVGVNVWGALHVTRALLPSMVTRRRGKVVFISSKAGVSPSAGLAVHSGTKHMLEAVAKALRQELSGTGVSVSVCRPGGVNTPGYAHATGVELSPAARSSLGTWIPTDPGKCLQPEDVARTIVGVVEMMGVADIQELSIEAPVTPQ